MTTSSCCLLQFIVTSMVMATASITTSEHTFAFGNNWGVDDVTTSVGVLFRHRVASRLYYVIDDACTARLKVSLKITIFCYWKLWRTSCIFFFLIEETRENASSYIHFFMLFVLLENCQLPWETGFTAHPLCLMLPPQATLYCRLCLSIFGQPGSQSRRGQWWTLTRYLELIDCLGMWEVVVG